MATVMALNNAIVPTSCLARPRALSARLRASGPKLRPYRSVQELVRHHLVDASVMSVQRMIIGLAVVDVTEQRP